MQSLNNFELTKITDERFLFFNLQPLCIIAYLVLTMTPGKAVGEKDVWAALASLIKLLRRRAIAEICSTTPK